MRQTLSSLDELGKLKMAIECMEQGVPFPAAIIDFLIEHGLYEIIIKPKVRYDTTSKINTSRKSGVRKRTKG